MKDDARLFNCVHCQRQVLICSTCDRGNIYCGPTCSKLARARLLQGVRQRYQRSRKGKLHHADQQRRYRKRKKMKMKIVMDHGSPIPDVHDLLSRSDKIAVSIGNHMVGCHFCGKHCAPFLRMDFLRSPQTKKV